MGMVLQVTHHVKMLTPPGPTSRPRMISTMPIRTPPRTRVTMPQTTRITARIHSRNVICCSLLRADIGAPGCITSNLLGFNRDLHERAPDLLRHRRPGGLDHPRRRALRAGGEAGQ